MASEYDDDKLNDALSSQQYLDYELWPHSKPYRRNIVHD